MDRIKELVDAYTAPKTWLEFIKLVKAEQDVLLSDEVLQDVRERTERRRASPNEPGPDLEKLEGLYLRFLELARAQGIVRAYRFIRYEREPRGRLFLRLYRLLPVGPRKALDERLDQAIAEFMNNPDAGFDVQAYIERYHSDDPHMAELSFQIAQGLKKDDSLDSLEDLLNKYAQLDTLQKPEDMARRSQLFEELSSDSAQLESSAMSVMNLIELGRALLNTPTGDRYANIERAIENFRTALVTLSRNEQPLTWAETMNLLGRTYQEHLDGENAKNARRAIECHEAALEVFTRKAHPTQWAYTQFLLGEAYLQLADTRGAISYFQAALRVVSRETHAEQWAMLQRSLGSAYSELTGRWRNWGLRRSIKHYRRALQGLPRETAPDEWAEVQNRLGDAYQGLVRAGKKRFQQRALAAFRKAVDATPPEIFPDDRLMYLINLSLAQQEVGDWAGTHASLVEAREVRRTIIDAASSETSRLRLIAEEARREIYWRDAGAILHLPSPDLKEVAIALEEGRAQAQRAILDMDTIDLLENADTAAHKRAQDFIDARKNWRDVQLKMDQPLPPEGAITEQSALREQRLRRVRDARAAFERARDAIRDFDQKPDFLSLLPKWEGIYRAITAPDEALVYLVPGLEGDGMVLIITQDQQVQYLALPAFTAQALIDSHQTLAPHPLTKHPFICGGLVHAQRGKAFFYLCLWGASVRDTLQHLPPTCGFARAIHKLEQQWQHTPKYSLLQKPFVHLESNEEVMLANSFTSTLLSIEVETVRQRLSRLGIREVARALEVRGIRKVAIVPYWMLSLFPLSAVSIMTSTEGKESCFGDLFEVTVIPSAYALEVAKRRKMSEESRRRALIFAVGNPQPLPREGDELKFAEAEVDTIRCIAQARGLPVRCLVREEAQRFAVIAGLGEAKIAHLAMHGQYLLEDPLQSKLILSGDAAVSEEERVITLEQCLKGEINLVGMQLLNLSACQLSLVDVQEVANEALGMASGLLQAGAANVIAPLWAVDDEATYLLMSHFINLYLDPARGWSPARCLAEAQRWLREEATNEVLCSTQGLTSPSQRPVLGWNRSLSFSQEDALHMIRIKADLAEDPNALPYKNPYFWAAFTVTGC